MSGPPWYGTDAWSFPLKGKWESFANVTLPPGGGPLVATGDFTRTEGEWPTIQLFDYVSLGIPGDSGLRSVSQEWLDHPNFSWPFAQTGWIKKDGWMVWIRWRFYNGLPIPANEVKVERGNQPLGALLGPDRHVDDKVHTLIFPSGATAWEYHVDLPPEVNRMTCDMQYDGGPQTHLPFGFMGFGSFIISHEIAPDPPPWPYPTPQVASPPAGKLPTMRRVTGNPAPSLTFNGTTPILT